MKMKRFLIRFHDAFVFSWRDTGIMLLSLVLTTGVCFLVHSIDESDISVVLIYLLNVVIISRLTKGYFYGIVSSFLSVLGINYVFIAPYFSLCFSLPTYPLTFIGMISITLIISAMTKTIEEYEKRRYQLRSEELRANLLRAISHDLRTPLAAISGSAAILKEHPQMDEAQKNEILRDISDEADWMIRMVENLLSITRINSQPASIKKTTEVAEEIVGESIRKFRKRFPDMPINTNLPQEVLVVPMDAMLIEQVLTNLLINVILHAQTATKIDLLLYRKGAYAVFEVRDNGVGIDPRKKDTLFRNMQEADSGTPDKSRCMGIGLSVCQSIVHAHGGDIKASNLPGGGASFRFRLPLEETR